MADLSDLAGAIPAMQAYAEQVRAMHETEVATAHSSRVDMSMYPDIVQELGSLAEQVTGATHGYVLSRKADCWYVDETRRTLAVHPLHERRIENAPFFIKGILYAGGGVLHLLPRAQVIAAHRAVFEREHRYRPEHSYDGLLVLRDDLHNAQIYGLEVSIREEHDLGRAFAEALGQSPLRVQLLERTTVANTSPRDCGFEQRMLYVPVTEAEKKDEILL